MNEKKIVVSCTFREFDGSENDKIQRLFLDSIKNQTYKNIILAVTNFREKNVHDVIKESGIDFVFFQSKMDVKFYSISEVCSNAASLLTPGDSVLLHTSADHIFPDYFFETVIMNLPKDGSVTSFPQRIYDGIAAWGANSSIEDNDDDLRLDRGMFEGVDDKDLPGIYRMDPNHWLPDTVAVDGDLFLKSNARELLMKYAQRDASPGVAQNTLLAFLAAPGKRKNIVFQARYVELLNDYATDTLSVEGAETYEKIRKNQYHQAKENWKNINAYAHSIGLEFHEYQDQPYLKIDQLSQYEVAGSNEQKLAFKAYLELWRFRYLMRSGEVKACDQIVNAMDHLKQTIRFLSEIAAPVPLSHLKRYNRIWLYGTGGASEFALGVLEDENFIIAGVADSFRTGDWHGFSVNKPKELAELVAANDVILIASQYWEDIKLTIGQVGAMSDIFQAVIEDRPDTTILIQKV